MVNLKVEPEPLIDKYKIPVQHFEYSYIETCRDGRELEKIVQVLRSGQEGHFPDLTRFAENRLAVVRPKSKLLRVAVPVISKESLEKDERNELTKDLTQWVSTVSKEDDELSYYKNRKSGPTLPDVRESTEKVLENEKKSVRRIASTDYSSWDKYDPDTEILKMDLAEENLKKNALNTPKKHTGKKVHFRQFLTDVEAAHEANYAKNKGNEFFKAGDYNEALKHYTESINCKASLAAFTNRALANLRLKKYKKALDDCQAALAIEPHNFKALLRKAQALDGLGHHIEASETVEQAIEINPNNELAQELADKFRKLCGSVARRTRLVVEDVSDNEVIIPIPGTSTMAPPFYVTCDGDLEKIGKANRVVHMVSVDCAEEDDDCCTVNHLTRICSQSGKDNETQTASVKESKNDCSFSSNKKKCAKEVSLTHNSEEKALNTKNKRQIVEEDKCAGGEPYTKQDESIDLPPDINSPYSFLKTWNSANGDPTFQQHATILRSIDLNRIVDGLF
ncbi:Sperm-associated antigen 1-like Protein [Tribolium castaneum]|uniref:Sperm-associated antigen 1-like Protein n=1 Tax=Tribolium castaneum TaxID=7070 RepID=D6WNX4_TRICA|nr:PREDICTED: sperm-associated antigen 1 [Tribolium castaneum]EFA03196.1 Sperm-associated antigen 1-like Protein [Tribolium castaneum]|eukprot:XP_015835761.1 PREDICTED: sperm-associated antigen 1 [Tribolium castaneum]